MEELGSAVIALGAVLNGTETDGRGMEFNPVPEGAELRGIDRDEADVLGSGATEVTLLFSALYSGP